MDDDIEIEEHDILEHPLVKEVFPDLSKIKIQVHTEAYAASLIHNEECNLIDEIPNYIEHNFAEEFYPGNGEEFENAQEKHLEEEFLDKEPDNAAQVDPLQDEDNIHDPYEILPDVINKTCNRKVEIVHEISDDEAMAEVTKKNVTNVANETQTYIKQYKVNFKSFNSVEIVNCVEISDDEENNLSINGHNSKKCTASNKNVATDIDEVTTAIEIVKDNEHKNGDDHSVDNEDSDIEKIRDANEVCMIDNQCVATEVSNDEKEKNCESLVDGHDDLLDENQNSPLENLQESEKSLVREDNTVHENPHEYEAYQMVNDEYITGDLDVVENRHKRVQARNSNSIVDCQNEVDEMDTEISEETYIGAPIKQEFEDVDIKEEIMDDFAEEYNFDESVSEMGENLNVTPTFQETTAYMPNKIILGTKPSPTIRPHVKNYSCLMVRLEDWGKYLNQSPCYCRKCKILFTTPNALDYHNMSAHSLLAPITNRAVKSTAKSHKPNIAKKSTSAHSLLAPITNRAVKSTAKSYKPNLAKKSTSSTDLDKSTHCSHCNINFKDNIALIKHLYELLPQQYNCNLCSKTFNSQNDLANHSAVHVKLEQRKILKPKKYLDNPMLRSLLTQKPKIPLKAKNIQPKVPFKIKTEPVDDSGFRFKCMVCSDILSNYGLARKHRETHPEKKNQMIFKKIITIGKLKRTKDKLVYEDEKPIKKHKLTKDPFSSDCDDSKTNVEIVPKSALFQCPKCHLHFTSTTAGIAHMGRSNCDLSKCPIWTCPTCKKKMRIKDTEIHKRQHQLSSKLKIYKLTKNSHERTLCKCLKCNVHFEYILLKMHLQNCGKIPTAKCQKCNILLMKNKLLGHMTKHDILKLKPKDFIFVEYLIANDKNKKINKEKFTAKTAVTSSGVDIRKPLIVKTKPGVELTQKFLKVDRLEKTRTKKYRMYFCNHCKISLTCIRKPESHFAKKCVVYSKQSFACNKCGLFLPWNTKQSHARLHEQKNFSIKDIQFVDLVTKKPIALPMIKYTSCTTCKIHFLTKGDRRKHICGEDYENCEYCGDMFEISTLKIHREFHQARKLMSKPKSDKSKPETSKSVIPELMMRYESLNPTWNILFICSKCELVTDLYNKAVEHSQEHLKKSYKQPKSITCYICDLLFEETCWAKHKELHTQMNITRKAFKILTYTPENLLEESWFQMFESVPEKEIRQIIDQSVFGGERSLKMKLMKYGLPEFTLYCCSNCQVCYDTNNLTAHVNVECKGSKYRCSECEIAFENESTLTFHKLLHVRGIKREEFRIIHFIKTTQSVKTNSDKEHAVSSKTKEKELTFSNINKKVDPRALKVLMEVRERVGNVEIDFDTPVELNPRAKFSLYRCIKCSACIHMSIHRNKHKCAPVHELSFCAICKQNVHARRKGNHKAKHDLNPNFRPKNTNIFDFDLKDLNQMNPRKSYKRSDLNGKKKYKNRKVVCSKAKTTKGNKKTPKSSKESKVIRANSVESFENFVKTITSDTKTEDSNRELNSAQESYINQGYRRSKTDDSNRELNLAQESFINQGYRRSFKIYKCDCGLHYTSIKSIDKHMETCNSGVEISTENCSKCGLLFPTEILVTHLCKHHSVDIDPDITVEEVKKKNDSRVTRTNTGAKNKRNIRETNSTEEGKTNKNESSENDISTEVKDKNNSRDYVKIYKCGECQVHYLNQNTCYKHAYKNHIKLDPRKFIDCKVCGLAFTLASLQGHITKHHATELNLEKVLVEEYHPGTGKEALKIDIYFANAKVQNVLVSSSND